MFVSQVSTPVAKTTRNGLDIPRMLPPMRTSRPWVNESCPQVVRRALVQPRTSLCGLDANSRDPYVATFKEEKVGFQRIYDGANLAVPLVNNWIETPLQVFSLLQFGPPHSLAPPSQPTSRTNVCAFTRTCLHGLRVHVSSNESEVMNE